MSKKQNQSTHSRRRFIGMTAATGAAFTIVPSFAVSGLGHVAPSDKLNVAGVGVGGIGRRDLGKITGQNIVALCDVDWDYAAKTFKDYPDAEVYKDYRVMLEKQKNIDAVLIATPDHTHAVIGMAAIRSGKHVLIQKPLSHSVYESQLLTKTAREYKVATQMGNQGNSSESVRRICELIWDGGIGEIREVHAWTNRPIWPQGLERPTEKMKVPKTLNWDLWLGPAPWRPYHSAYTPWNWRAWWDFGTGAMGDMGCHILDPVFQALKLKYPFSIQGSSTQVNTESAPVASMIKYEFPARVNLPRLAMPPVTLYWYDGGLRPDRPDDLDEGLRMGDGSGGALFVGTKGKLSCGLFGNSILTFPGELFKNYKQPEPTLRRVKDGTDGHWNDWIRACKESPESRMEASSNFEYSGPLSESVLLGNLAIRLQELDKTLQWDQLNMCLTNVSETNQVRVVSSDKFTVINGDPRFDTKYLTIPAKASAEEWIKHTYREGWSL
ncbi:MAG TPA: Gfo/Idh/MocA family oxidoreductase [Bacteroides sp.]|nr:Gfo/Idh/MocA family oxidoreductase [Bacteroides sp.]